MSDKYYLIDNSQTSSTNVDTTKIEELLQQQNEEKDRVNISLKEYERLKGIEDSRDILIQWIKQIDTDVLKRLNKDTLIKDSFRWQYGDDIMSGDRTIRLEFSWRMY